MLDNLKESLDTKATMNELFSLQASRGIAALSPRKILRSSLTVLLESTTQEVAIRSRVTTIKMSSLRTLLALENIIAPLRKYIISTYGHEMKNQGYTTVSAQKSYVDNIMKLFLQLQTEIDYLMKVSDLVLGDVDSASWALKRVQEVLEQSSRDR